ncbi:response regulator [Flavobacterium agricola]|uniref:histidine kinase n=1 Tax=Flavobacterium agricola TaxID=2870839 RepID=A0ABY6M335_9FLAO|nr:response regulator [Flavobacterium agricola]UYW02262.1 response regulator [Flavobacterium agricola]
MSKLHAQQNKTIAYTQLIYILLFGLLLFLAYSTYVLVKQYQVKNKMLQQIAFQNAELALAKDAAESRVLVKNQFIGKVSHEIRTPLYGIIGLTKVLEQDFTYLKQNKIIKALKFSSDYLMSLINDLLQLQKIEANAVKIEPSAYEIESEIKGIVSSLQPIANANNNQVQIHVSACSDSFIVIDKIKLNQILYNLISNALKFTKNGKVAVVIKQMQVAANQLLLQIQITDSGVGIASKNKSKLFDKFVRFNLKDSEYVGAGLGLSIVKQLVNVLQGEINVKSKLNVGTTFFVSIPCKNFQQQEDKPTAIANKITVDYKKLRLLLVENNEISRLSCQRMFEKHEIQCCMVQSGEAALELIKKQHFDVILTDINMPEMTGFELATYIRNLNKNMPIIALTAYNKEDVYNEIKKHQINDVVTKPFNFETLINAICNQMA